MYHNATSSLKLTSHALHQSGLSSYLPMKQYKTSRCVQELMVREESLLMAIEKEFKVQISMVEDSHLNNERQCYYF